MGKKYTVRYCMVCGKKFRAKRADARYDSAKCRKRINRFYENPFTSTMTRDEVEEAMRTMCQFATRKSNVPKEKDAEFDNEMAALIQGGLPYA